ncbi:MAPEG family protein [Kaarinaea lacus]
MDISELLLPLLAMVLLTAMVWITMYYTRIKEIFRKKIAVQSLANHTAGQKQLQRVAGPSDNLINLFEMPVLFYAAILTAYTIEFNSVALLYLAWIYVILRYIHSFIHVTYDKVIHRFSVYFTSSMVLWAMWIIIGADIVFNPTS